MSTYMTMDQVTVASPLWWLVTLERRLQERQAEMERFDAWYSGDHPLPFLTRSHNAKMVNEFRELLRDSKSNFMGLVVDAVEERLAVEGFRLSADADPVSDKATWDIWQANQMDAQTPTAFIESLSKGVSYLSVWADTDGDDFPDICVEDPRETIIAYEAGSNYRRRLAAVKIWLDEWTGARRANVYLPDAIYKFEEPANADPGREPSVPDKIRVLWAPLADATVRNPVGIVPIVPLRNRPRLLSEGESELRNVTAIQAQINGFLFLLALAGYFGAHRQRWSVGLKIMEDENGNPVEPFDVAVDRLWTSEDPTTRFGEFGQTDLTGYISAIEQKVLHIAVTTRTPRHYLIESGQSPSGDAIESAETGLVKKVIRKQRTFGEGIEEAMRLARMFAGETDAPVDSEVVWARPQSFQPGVVTDAVIKQWQTHLIPHATALEQLGYSQTQIRQILQADPGMFAADPAAQQTTDPAVSPMDPMAAQPSTA